MRNEYRESLDIDFLVSDQAGYRALRHMLTDRNGIKSVAREGMPITVVEALLRFFRKAQRGVAPICVLIHLLFDLSLWESGEKTFETAHA